MTEDFCVLCGFVFSNRQGHAKGHRDCMGGLAALKNLMRGRRRREGLRKK